MPDSGNVADRSIRSAVEELLLRHPDVIAAHLISEEAADGRHYPVAYVVPHPERLREAAARLQRADREKRVSQWKRTFDHTYRATINDPAPSFVGWTSSYTNQPLPAEEMREWRQATADRIASQRPCYVLEIGCGVGLLVEALAPLCASYAATDLSPVAIARLQDLVASRSELRHVALFEREATDLQDRAAQSIDTIVINSVVQYFPDIAYLRNIVTQAVRLVKSGGRLFIGDVRDFASLSLFHSAVQLAKAPADASAGWLKRKVALAVEQERELAIDPRFFLELARSDPRICGVELLVKRGKAHNEMTRYRYDVLLHVGQPETTTRPVDAVWQAGERSVAEILTQLETGRFTAVTIENLANARRVR
jgi:SAM-dependent methyltransferase